MLSENNTPTHFECEIDNLSYITIEEEISSYFSMGEPDDSDIPMDMKENSYQTCTLKCDKKSGSFRIKNYALKNDKYQLVVTALKISKCK